MEGQYSVGMNPQLTEKVFRLNDIVEEAVLLVLGLKKVREGKQWVRVKTGEAIVNPRGAAVFEQYLSSLVNRNTLLAAIKRDEEADRIIYSVGAAMISDFAAHADEYGLDLMKLDRLATVWANYAQLVLSRAVKEIHSDKEFLQHAVVEQHVTSEVSEQTSRKGDGGFLGNLFR